MRRVVTLALAAVAVLAAVTTWWVVRDSDDDDHQDTGLTVTWSETEEHPACVYRPGSDRAEATIAIDGTVADEETVTVTVTAYADENTSDLVGTGTGRAQVDGTVHRSLVVTIPVDRPPHVDEDGVAACALDSTY
ncbi:MULTISPECIES: hypothetical protein [unclassified Nocardioides]|uniref:hypothetical protein n=1 Tax=unclassified Nocardioides TaxID=2615069 RepID=UPI000A432A3F|nr:MULTISPECIES: hypothetical protein [unclassified Nocardioides]